MSIPHVHQWGIVTATYEDRYTRRGRVYKVLALVVRCRWCPETVRAEGEL